MQFVERGHFLVTLGWFGAPQTQVPSSELEVPTRDDSQPTPTPWCVFDACADGDRDRVGWLF